MPVAVACLSSPRPPIYFSFQHFVARMRAFFKNSGEIAKQPKLVATGSCYYPPASMKLIHSRETASSWHPPTKGTSHPPQPSQRSLGSGSKEGWQGFACHTASPALTGCSSLTINESSGDRFQEGASAAVSQVSRGSEQFVSSEMVLLLRVREKWKC